jgi:hypothetical protein
LDGSPGGLKFYASSSPAAFISAPRYLHQQGEDRPLGERENGAGHDPEDQDRRRGDAQGEGEGGARGAGNRDLGRGGGNKEMPVSGPSAAPTRSKTTWRVAILEQLPFRTMETGARQRKPGSVLWNGGYM